ncbi:MAG: N-acetyltransferase [Sphingobacteriaceae bacterium]|nr:N-acetyltransferase [Sphingobacteriaceae bacterium]
MNFNTDRYILNKIYIFVLLKSNSMPFDTQQVLENNEVILTPLVDEYYNQLLNTSLDPILWEHHPISNAYTTVGFDKFYKEAKAIGSLVIIDKIKDNVIGSTRFYNYNELESSVVIGHTFIAREYWGSGYNKSIKKLMLDYAFTHVNKVVFYVVEENIRSQKALEKLGAVAKGNIIRNYESKELKCILFEIEKGEQLC